MCVDEITRHAELIVSSLYVSPWHCWIVSKQIKHGAPFYHVVWPTSLAMCLASDFRSFYD